MIRVPASHRTSLPALTVHRERHKGFTSHYFVAHPSPFDMFGSSTSMLVTLSTRTQHEYWSDTLQRKYT